MHIYTYIYIYTYTLHIDFLFFRSNRSSCVLIRTVDFQNKLFWWPFNSATFARSWRWIIEELQISKREVMMDVDWGCFRQVLKPPTPGGFSRDILRQWTFFVGLCIHDFLHAFFPMTIVWFFRKSHQTWTHRLVFVVATRPSLLVFSSCGSWAVADHRGASRPWGGGGISAPRHQKVAARKNRQTTGKINWIVGWLVGWLVGKTTIYPNLLIKTVLKVFLWLRALPSTDFDACELISPKNRPLSSVETQRKIRSISSFGTI